MVRINEVSCQVVDTSVKSYGYGAVRSCSKLDSDGWLEGWSMAGEHGRWAMAHTFDSLKHAMKVLLNYLRIEYELLVLTFDGKENRQSVKCQ